MGVNGPQANAVVFDVEGTLIDCAMLTLECWRETLQDREYEFTLRELHPYSGLDGRIMLHEILATDDSELVDKLLREQGRRYREDYLPRAKEFPGASRAVESLWSAGYAISLATTCQPDELRHYLGLLNITGQVGAYACGADVEKEKPAPDVIQLAVRRLPCAAANVVVVGDTPYDAKAALHAGYRAIGVRGGGFSEAELLSAGCLEVAESLSDVPDIIKTRFPTSPYLGMP